VSVKEFVTSEAFFPYLWATMMTVTFNIVTLRANPFTGLTHRLRVSLWWFCTTWLIGKYCVRPLDPLVLRLFKK
jgi:hypothetical protein